MTLKWIFPVLAAAAAGVISFGVTRHAACRAAGPELDHLKNIAFLTKTLHLNDAQAREIEVLHDDLRARLKDCCDRHCAARKHLGQSLIAGDPEADRMDALLREMCDAYAESERLTLEHIRRVRNLLDTEQRRRFDELVLDALLCRNCPACGTETSEHSRRTIHGGGSHGNARPPGPESLDSARDPELVEGLVAEGLQRGSETEDARLEPGAPK